MSTEQPTALAGHIAAHQVAAGTLSAWWLGGSGMVFKTPGGTQVMIDPYLSDAVNTIFGLSRAFAPPLLAREVNADVVVSTHWHEDHLDPHAIPLIARRSPHTRFVMPPSAMSRALGWGVPRKRIDSLSAGQSVTIGDAEISHVPARHEAGVPGWEVPDAMGVVLTVAGLSIYNSGDTEYDLRLRALKSRGFDAAILCINGVGGNMNAHEAALLAWQLGVPAAIPVHHLLWETSDAGDEATLDPRLFEDTYNKLGGTGQIVIPEIGARIDFPITATAAKNTK